MEQTRAMDYNLVEVLLVEDNPTDAELTIRELKTHNLANNLYHAWDGEEALDFLFGKRKFSGTRTPEHPPKIIMLDINMPKINGIEVLKELKGNPVTKKIPVVMLTATREDPVINLCLKLGVNSYIVKPVKFEAFAKAIKELGFYWLLLNQQPI